MVPSWADQLLPQLLMEQFDTLSIQCGHIEHMHEGVYNFCLHTLNICMKEFIIFVCTDSTEIFFSKLRFAGSNYNLPCFFTDSYCGGVGVGGYLVSIAY